MSQLELNTVVSNFNEEKIKMERNYIPFRKNYDENDACEFGTLDSITQKQNLWSMIRTHVMRNPEFQVAINTRNKTPFHLRI